MTIPIETLRKSIGVSADLVKVWFESRTQPPSSKKQFETKGGLGDTGEGAVYAYFNMNGHALYVGQTGHGIKVRTQWQTSKQKKTTWRPQWTTVRFTQRADETDRLVLEFLLCLAYKPLRHCTIRNREQRKLTNYLVRQSRHHVRLFSSDRR